MPQVFLALFCFIFILPSALAEPAAPTSIATTNKSLIKLGMSNALSGPASSLGTDLKAGAEVYFNQLNKVDGINGRAVKLISLDDSYEPHNTVINTKNLLNQDVLALFSYVGTPTSYAIMPLINQSKIPYLMPFTGADFLRSPTNPNIFNLRASYFQEIKAQVNYLTTTKKFKKIALVIQADEFGLAAQRAVNAIFKSKGLNIIFTARYKRNSNDINSAAQKLSTTPVDAVIFVGTHKPFLNLINLTHNKGVNVVFSSLSFIGSHSVLNKLPKQSKVVLTEVVPEPSQCNWQICQQFISDMKGAGYRDLNRVQLEGYLNAFVFSQVAKRCIGQVTRQCLVREFQQFNYQDKSLQVSFSQNNHQGLQQTYFSFSEALK